MSASRPAGRYGIDAPWVPWLWAALGALYVVFAVLSPTVWGNPAWLTFVFAVLAAAFFAGGGLYWHATVRGKLQVREEPLVHAEAPVRVLDMGCGHGAERRRWTRPGVC